MLVTLDARFAMLVMLFASGVSAVLLSRSMVKEERRQHPREVQLPRDADELFEALKHAYVPRHPDEQVLPAAVTFIGLKCSVVISQYPNSSPRIDLRSKSENEQVATASLYLPDVVLAAGEVAIKNYSENEGLLPVLLEAGVLELTDKKTQTGRVVVPVRRLMAPAGP